MARIIWAPKATDDLDQLADYIARDAPGVARRFARKLVARVEMLTNHPLLGGFIAEDDSHTYREVLQGNYRVIYRTDGQTVYVVAVHHAARLLDTRDLE